MYIDKHIRRMTGDIALRKLSSVIYVRNLRKGKNKKYVKFNTKLIFLKILNIQESLYIITNLIEIW